MPFWDPEFTGFSSDFWHIKVIILFMSKKYKIGCLLSKVSQFTDDSNFKRQKLHFLNWSPIWSHRTIWNSSTNIVFWTKGVTNKLFKEHKKAKKVCSDWMYFNNLKKLNLFSRFEFEHERFFATSDLAASKNLLNLRIVISDSRARVGNSFFLRATLETKIAYRGQFKFCNNLKSNVWFFTK